MNKTKSVFVTAALLIMLLLIAVCLFKLWLIGFHIIVGAFAVYGMALSAVHFFEWLQTEKKEEVLPPPVVNGDMFGVSEDYAETYEKIRDEILNGEK